MAIRVTHFAFAGVNHMNAYLVWCPGSRRGILVDPGGFDDRITGMVDAHRLEVTGILLTHSHWDHADGLADACKALGAPVLASPAALKRAGRDAARSRAVGEGDEIDIGGHPGTVYEVPGHIDDQIVVHVEGHLLAGDTLFAAALGGTSGAEAFHLQAGIVRKLLFHLPPDTVVHSGHGPATEVGLERIFNPFLKGIEPRWKSAPGGW